jgi:hypothetical protein
MDICLALLRSVAIAKFSKLEEPVDVVCNTVRLVGIFVYPTDLSNLKYIQK